MSNHLDKIERLHALFGRGAISEDEFRAEKARILSPHISQQSSDSDQTAVSSEFSEEPSWAEIEPSSSHRRRPIFFLSLLTVVVCGAALWFFTPSFTSNASDRDSLIKAEKSDFAAASQHPEEAPIGAISDGMPAKEDLLGKGYAEVLQDKPYNPAAGLGSEGNFDTTLSGPQTPSIATIIDGKEILVWENCMAHLCPDARSVIAVEVDGPGRFVATIIGGQTQIIKNASFGRALLSQCTGFSCEFDAVPQAMGRQSDISALKDADLDWAYGGASCRAENSAGELVFYTEGEAVIRFKGRLRRIAESDGIGVGPWSSDDGFDDSLLVEIEKSDGPSEAFEEGVSYPAVLKAFDGETTSVPVTMICEA